MGSPTPLRPSGGHVGTAAAYGAPALSNANRAPGVRRGGFPLEARPRHSRPVDRTCSDSDGSALQHGRYMCRMRIAWSSAVPPAPWSGTGRAWVRSRSRVAVRPVGGVSFGQCRRRRGPPPGPSKGHMPGSVRSPCRGRAAAPAPPCRRKRPRMTGGPGQTPRGAPERAGPAQERIVSDRSDGSRCARVRGGRLTRCGRTAVPGRGRHASPGRQQT